MGFLLGLPLRLLGLVFGLIRFLIPVALLVLLGIWLYRKYGGHRPADSGKKDEPHFKVPHNVSAEYIKQMQAESKQESIDKRTGRVSLKWLAFCTTAGKYLMNAY